PPIAILAGLAGAFVLERLRQHARFALATGAAVLAAAIATPTVEMVRLHPYQYTHFNHLAGGIRAADEHFMLDYWGLAFKQAGQELRARLTERLEVPVGHPRWRIAVCGPHRPAQVELG